MGKHDSESHHDARFHGEKFSGFQLRYGARTFAGGQTGGRPVTAHDNEEYL
jgi:hypothetical protein